MIQATILYSRFIFITLGFFSVLTTLGYAAETEYTLEPIVVKAKSSFDSLGEDEYLPQKKISFEASRSGTLDTLEKFQVFPSKNLGFPSGATGTNLGGRSSEDAQVSTLGVPLNLPQGGGPDLSIFPSFLWSGASVSTVPSIAGFSPQGVSGSVQFDLWTRTQVRELKRSTSISRVTGNYDRNLQNFSVATKKENTSILAGMNFGRQKGPVGSLSLYAIRKPRSHLLFHMLGSDQDGDNPGSKKYSTPTQRKKFWRVIPVLESHQEFGDEESALIWESTLYADFQQLKIDPLISNDRTQLYGAENALHWDRSTLAFTARFVNYQSTTFGTVNEWPLLAQYSHEFPLSDSWKMKLGGGGNFVTSVGFAPTARATFKNEMSPDSSWFYELNSLVKMPTLVARYYYLPGIYFGNPNLKPERVNALIGGYTSKKNTIETTTTAKAEYRTQIQVLNRNYDSTINSGNASLFSLAEDFVWKPFPYLSQSLGILLTYSNLSDSKFPYPDLPYFSILWNGRYSPAENLDLNPTAKYMGRSTTSGGGVHEDYLLIGLSMDYHFMKDLVVTLGCDNITDKRAEMVVDYPLPGRIGYLNFMANF